MPAKDAYHEVVRIALEVDDWQITHDPYKVMLGRRKGFIDLGAEKLLAAEKGEQRIAVEVKSFLRPSALDEFEDALGQFLLYKVALETTDPTRLLLLAVPNGIYVDFFDDPFFRNILTRFGVPLLVFDEQQKIIVKWIN
jgi:XisH protein